ncbi:hypothetical protein ACLQ28_05765 [Micromonospora sp. DT201]|uniref:hypothetical protein n=1 Tax=Micromonospora sp. DT201 TaxID=3393442 RepID=UPI003CEBEAFE
MSESAQQREPGQVDPDVLLDIPKVSVDAIRLAVDGLEADLSLRARVANLLQVDAGVRVHLSGGELDVNGAHAEAQLRVRLDQLATILGRALDTLDNNPQIIEALARTAATDVDEVHHGAQQLAAGATGVRASAGALDQPGQPVGAAGAFADSARSGSSRQGPGPGDGAHSGSGRQGPGPGRPASSPGSGGPPAGGPGPHAGGPGPSAGGPGPSAGGPGFRAGGPASGDQTHPESGGTQDRHQGSRRHGERHHPEGQRPAGSGAAQRPAGSGAAQRPAGAGWGAEGPAGSRAGQPGNRPDQSPAPGPSPAKDGDGGGVAGGAHAAAQSAAQLAEQAGETLRQAGRSVWAAIQEGMAQHRQQGRRDN